MSEIVTIADAHGTICTLNLNQATHVDEVQQKLRIALNGDPRPVQEVKVIVWKVFTELRDKYINKSPEFFTQAVFRTLLSQAPIGVGLGPRGHSLLMEAVRYNESCMAALLNVHNEHPHRFPLDKHLRSQDGKFPFHVAARDYPAIALQLLDSVTDYALAGSAVSGFPLMACLIDDIFNGIHTGPVHCQLTRCLLQPCFDLRFPLIGYESAACVEVRSLSGQLQKECRTPEQLFEKYM
jgi:hypothetical protein